MPYQRSVEPHDLGMSPRCIHFRSKAMYVAGERTPQDVDEPHDHDHNCWCNMTQHVMGQDHTLVQLDQCGEGRDCFRPV